MYKTQFPMFNDQLIGHWSLNIGHYSFSGGVLWLLVRGGEE